jgi:hypothetical protein
MSKLSLGAVHRRNESSRCVLKLSRREQNHERKASKKAIYFSDLNNLHRLPRGDGVQWPITDIGKTVPVKLLAQYKIGSVCTIDGGFVRCKMVKPRFAR